MSTLGKRPGSRRFKAAAKGCVGFPEWHEGTPPGREEVGIDFVCARKGHKATVLGQFRMETHDGSDRRVLVVARPDGTLPEEAGRPEGQAKALLICDCGHELRISQRRIEEDLNALWAPHAMRVVTKEI